LTNAGITKQNRQAYPETAYPETTLDKKISKKNCWTFDALPYKKASQLTVIRRKRASFIRDNRHAENENKESDCETLSQNSLGQA